MPRIIDAKVSVSDLGTRNAPDDDTGSEDDIDPANRRDLALAAAGWFGCRMHSSDLVSPDRRQPAQFTSSLAANTNALPRTEACTLNR